MKLLARIVRKLEEMGAPCALIGGVALAFHGIDRATEDIDLLVTDVSVLKATLWDDLQSEGIAVDVREGDYAPARVPAPTHPVDLAGLPPPARAYPLSA